MNPITRTEQFLAAAAGEYDGGLPEPVTRLEHYLSKIKTVGDHLQSEIDMIAGMVEVESWADVQKIVRAGMAGSFFSVGDQLTCQKDGVNLVWDIIGIDHDMPADLQYTHSMTLQLHDTLSTRIQFDNPEALYYAESGLAAGTYHFAIGTTNYQFDLASAVPAGGQLILNYNGTTPSTISVSAAKGGEAVGEIPITTGSGGTTLTAVNSSQRMKYGSNRYKESSLRQWLNSDDAAGSVWSPQNDFDRPPTWAATTAGFMNGLDADFIAVIGNTKITVAKNTITDGGGFETLDDKFFLPSRSEVYGGLENSVTEGTPYPYYSAHSDLSEAGIGADSNRVKTQSWWLRTPVSNEDHRLRINKNTDGSINANYSVYTTGLSIVCNII